MIHELYDSIQIPFLNFLENRKAFRKETPSEVFGLVTDEVSHTYKITPILQFLFSNLITLILYRRPEMILN